MQLAFERVTVEPLVYSVEMIKVGTAQSFITNEISCNVCDMKHRISTSLSYKVADHGAIL